MIQEIVVLMLFIAAGFYLYRAIGKELSDGTKHCDQCLPKEKQNKI